MGIAYLDRDLPCLTVFDNNRLNRYWVWNINAKRIAM
ncbi:hypothetical protein Y024_5787 [Burkholderia pseudomallei TSV44]|nr:hypothetical protein Y024_5787 [Burkholderia pseudomallei TSV44]